MVLRDHFLKGSGLCRGMNKLGRSANLTKDQVAHCLRNSFTLFASDFHHTLRRKYSVRLRAFFVNELIKMTPNFIKSL